MKKKFTCLVFAFIAILSFTNSFGQASCPNIVVTSYRIITNPLNPCLKSISVDFKNPTNGAKSIGIKVTCSNIQILSECHDASGQQGVQRNITTASFTCCNLTQLMVEIAAYTGNSTCLGTPCVQKFSIAGASLPVTFSSFTATRKDQNVELKWATSSEQNNSGFELERKSGVNDWAKIASVSSLAQSGNSSNLLTYSYTDLNNITVVSTYRIKQIDFDGKIKYSEILAVAGNKANGRTTMVYPNPGKSGEVKVIFKESSGSYSASLSDVNGRVLKNWVTAAGSTITIDNVIPGLYSLRVMEKQSGESSIEKIIIR